MALSSRPIRVLSVFSGCGWLDLAVKLAVRRARCVGYVEREAYAAATLVARMEDEALDKAPLWDDATTLDCRRYRGSVDLVVAGFPCPPVSVAGKRKGTQDERWLWPEVVRIIRETGARGAFLENVGGLLSANAGREFGEVLRDLARLGFDAEWVRLPARDVGAAHERERVFILAHSVQLRGGERPGRKRVLDSGAKGRRALALRSPGGRGELRKPSRRDGQPHRSHEEVADAGDRQLPLEGRGPAGRDGAGSTGPLVADPRCSALERRGESRELPRPEAEAQGERNQRQRRGDAALDPGPVVAHAGDQPSGPQQEFKPDQWAYFSRGSSTRNVGDAASSRHGQGRPEEGGSVRDEARGEESDGRRDGVADPQDDHGRRGERGQEEGTRSSGVGGRGPSGGGERLADAASGQPGRIEDAGRQPVEGRQDPRPGGEALADPDGDGLGGGGEAGGEARPQPARGIEEVLRRLRELDIDVEPCPDNGTENADVVDRWHTRDYCSNLEGLRGILAHAEFEGSQGAGSQDEAWRGEPLSFHRDGREIPLFAPGPGDALWRDILGDLAYLAPAIEPGLRVLVDGRPLVVDEGRADQLRLGGNGVVAIQGAAAFIELDRRLGSGFVT